jgi:hypothetical protein
LNSNIAGIVRGGGQMRQHPKFRELKHDVEEEKVEGNIENEDFHTVFEGMQRAMSKID